MQKRSFVVFIALATAFVGAAVAPVGYAYQAAGAAEEEGAPKDLRADTIWWTGSTCADREVFVRLHFEATTVAKEVVIGTSNDDQCLPLPGAITATESAAPVENGSASSSLESTCGLNSNYVHASHTLQDVVRIDVAWLRSSFKRYWNCDGAWYDRNREVMAWSDGGPAWWIAGVPDYPIVEWSCDNNPFCFFATASARSTFHTDFLHCNAINQDMVLTNAVNAWDDGSFTVDFQKRGSCPGVFSATGARAGARGDHFGGTAQTTAMCAIPPNERPSTAVACPVP